MDEISIYARVRELRTPKTAAVAGILFAILQLTSLYLVRSMIPPTSADMGEWLTQSGGSIGFAISLVPFAGIAFLWYMGVIRDHMGRLEDQFYSTLFIGSGLLYLSMTFVSSAMAAAILYVYDLDPQFLMQGESYLVLRAVMFAINTNYAVRMAGMNTLVLGTIATSTGLMPRWLAWPTFLVAIVLLLTSSLTSWTTMVFPAWVGVLSVYVLVHNLRTKRHTVRAERRTRDDGAA